MTNRHYAIKPSLDSNNQSTSRAQIGFATATRPDAPVAHGHNAGERLLRLPELIRMIGVSRATIYRYVDSGRIPRPIRLSTRCIAWRASEITAWMAALHAA